MKQTKSFEEWLEALEAYAETKGHTKRPYGMLQWEVDAWRKMYNQGLTPQQAWERL